jgi:peptidylprolyl isomerase
MFDTTLKDGKPVTFRLDEVIPGWTEGLGTMVVGERRRLWIPQKLAYDGQPGAPAGMLVFDVELVAVH